MNTMVLSVLVAIPSFVLAGILVASTIPYIFNCQVKGPEIVLKFFGILPTGRIKFRDIAEIRMTTFSPEIPDWGNALFKAGKPVMFRPLGHLHGIFSKTFVIREKNGCDREVFISSKDAENFLAAVTKACNLNPRASEQQGGS